MANFRTKYFAALCDAPNVLIPSEHLEGDPTKGPWLLPQAIYDWLNANVGAESSSLIYDDEAHRYDLQPDTRWNWAVQEVSVPSPKSIYDRFKAHFVFVDAKDAALFKMIWA